VSPDWRQRFRTWIDRVTSGADAAGVFPCPCCECLTLIELGDYELCPVCFWEDDPYQSADPELVDGANGYSLVSARESYAAIGSSHPIYARRVRGPRPTELPT